jgi:tRNA isopentenyl-2-thiomethyl-A-37 hydroxylase MiaE
MASGWLTWVRNNDKVILTVLEEHAATLVKATSTLMELVSNYANILEKIPSLKNLNIKEIK